MTEFSLIYRLSPDIEENPIKREIDVLSNDSIASLREKIYEKVKSEYIDFDAEDLKLLKVHINNEEGDFSRLVPKNIEGANKLRGTINVNEFWAIQPSQEFTHIIVDSPRLTTSNWLKTALTRLEQYEGASDYIIPNIYRAGFQDLYYAKIIRINDVLQIDKEYSRTKVFIQCKVVDFDAVTLFVCLIDGKEQRKKGFFHIEELEKWLVECSILGDEDKPREYKHSGENVEIIRNGVWLGSIRERKNYYFKNQELKKRYKDSAKSELKQDAGLSKEFNRLSVSETKDYDYSVDSESNTVSVYDQYETSENIEERPEEEYIENIKNGAVQLGFIRDKFAQWLSSISDDIVATQTLEYWLLSYVSDLETNFWNEDISPSAWLSSRFAITLETADTIINSISEDYLQGQTPQYWIKEWILQCTNPASDEFNNFIENAPVNTSVSYGGNQNIFIIDKKPVSGDDDELYLLLRAKSRPTPDNHTYYYHTTNRSRTEFIIENGIDVTMYPRQQDFGCSSSFYLNDEFRWATEWARKHYLNPTSCVILVYDIPKELLLEYDHLDLSNDPKKWKVVVRKSRNGVTNDADDYGSIYGPQAENVEMMIKNRLLTPRPSISKNQLALKVRKLTKRIDELLIGVIIYKTS